mgnify:FL=1
MKKIIICISIILSCFIVNAQSTVKIALLKYSGGGDWYANPTSLPNLIEFCNKNIGTTIHANPDNIDVGSSNIFNYPYTHITGHGNIIFSDDDAKNLRDYMLSGGFLHIDDNYGLDEFIVKQMKKVFPEHDFVELPFSHPIFHQKYDFDDGLPKIHEHNNNPPQAFAIIVDGRMVCLYTFECDLGDGWEHTSVHNDSEENHLKALQMGANIIQFVFNDNGQI